MKTKANVLVLSGYGLNCEAETLHAFQSVGARGAVVHVNDLIAQPSLLKKYNILAFPGGFSYGDDTGSGRAYGNKIKNHLQKELRAFVERDTLTIGICNGFQILVESHLLPGALMRNQSLHFVCESVPLKVENNKLPFTNKYKKGEEIHLPIAHRDGNYYLDEKRLDEIEKNNQIVFRYQKNPNGSLHDIAGITNKEGNILGLMPHPERASESILGSEDGRRLFESAISVLEVRETTKS